MREVERRASKIVGFAVLAPIEICLALVVDISLGRSLSTVDLAIATTLLTMLNLVFGEWFGNRFKKLTIFELIFLLVLGGAEKSVDREIEAENAAREKARQTQQ